MAELFETDDDLGFWENMGQEPGPEAAAPETGTTVVEAVADVAPADPADNAEEATTAPERPRNADGTFAKAEPDGTQEAVEEAQERLLAGNFKSAEDLERGYVELRQRFNERDAEVSELRQLREQFEQLREQMRPQPQQAPAVEQIQEQLYENPHAIIPTIQQAHQAALAGDPNAATVRDAALATLRELNGVEAERYSRWVATTEWQAAQQQTVQQQTQLDGAWQQAAAEFAQSAPDFNQFAPQIADLAGRPENADLLKLLEVGGPQARISVLRVLYNEARGQATDNLRQASQEIQRTQAQDAERAAQDAAVVTTTTAKPPPAPQTAADRIGAEWEQIESSLSDGWNIGNNR